jgi:hypothetical protein
MDVRGDIVSSFLQTCDPCEIRDLFQYFPYLVTLLLCHFVTI